MNPGETGVKTCRDCGKPLEDEYAYILLERVWLTTVRRAQSASSLRARHPQRPSKRDYCCIGCIESRLGRTLKRNDFDWSIPLNYWPNFRRSERLLERMNRLLAQPGFDAMIDVMKIEMEKLVREAELRKNHVPYDRRKQDELLKDPEKMAVWIRKSSSSRVLAVIAGWQVILSIDVFTDGFVHYHASAMLYPKGRSSTEEDWKNLGQIVVLSGAPEETPIPFGMSDDPGAPQHWFWYRLTPFC